jgi:hypothetical protein
MPYPEKYIKAGNTLWRNRTKPFVQRILMGQDQPIYGYDNRGYGMTHLMTSVDNFAMPSLQYDPRTKEWTNLLDVSNQQLVEQSLGTNNAIEFTTPEEAEAFAKDYHFVMNPGFIENAKQNPKAFKKYLKP